MRKVSPAIRCLFVLPAVLWFCAAIIVPVGMAVKDSFYSWDGITAKVFIGLDNYKELLHDEIVWNFETFTGNAFWCVFVSSYWNVFCSYFVQSKIKRKKFFQNGFLPSCYIIFFPPWYFVGADL